MPRERHFTARFNNLLVRDQAQIRANLASRREQVVDARCAGRFDGSEPEPRPGTAQRPYPRQPQSSLHRSARSQEQDPAACGRDCDRVSPAGIDLSKPVVTSCGSGVTAAVLAFALHLIGHRGRRALRRFLDRMGPPGDTPVEP